MKLSIRTTIRSFFSFIGSLFITGLLTILPIILTIGLFTITLKTLKNWLEPLGRFSPEWLQKIPFSEFIVAITFVLLIGLIINVLLLRSLFSYIESAISRIPLVRPVYTGFKQLLEAFNPTDKQSFKQVVLIEFPRKGIFSIGFVTSEMASGLTPTNHTTYYGVFIPTTPMPTNGYFLIIPADDVKVVNLTRQEAMALIISGGIIQPNRFTNV